MSYLIFGNDGCIDDVKKLIKRPKKTFKTINDVFDHLVETTNDIAIDKLDKRDLFVNYYCHDERIGKDVYMITCAKRGNEDYMRKYHWPQYLRYMVEV